MSISMQLFRKFVLFCFVGGISSLIDLAVLITLVELLSMPVLFAAGVGVLVASVNGYILNRVLTFKNRSQRIAGQYIAYLLVSIVGLLLTLLCMHMFIEYLQLHYIVAKLITIVLVTSWNFTINHLFVFKEVSIQK